MEFSRPEHWSGLPFPSPGDLPNPGMEPGSPVLQVDSLPTELSGKPCMSLNQREEERKERKGRESKRIEVITQTHSFYSLRFLFVVQLLSCVRLFLTPGTAACSLIHVPQHILDVVQAHVH